MVEIETTAEDEEVSLWPRLGRDAPLQAGGLYRFRCTNNSVLNSAIVWHNVKFYIPVRSLCLWWVDCQLSQTLRSGKSIYFVTTVFWLLLMLATQFQVCSFYKINAWPHSPFTNHIFRLRWNERYNNICELEFYPSLQWRIINRG